MELFLICIAVAYTLTGKYNKDTAQSAYKAGKEPPGLAKARMRHESGGGGWKPGKSGKSKPAGKGGARLVLASKWSQACEKTKERSDAKHRAWRSWFAEQADQHDQQWRDKQARKIAKSESRADTFARARGILAHPVQTRRDKQEQQAWDENTRRDQQLEQDKEQQSEQDTSQAASEQQPSDAAELDQFAKDNPEIDKFASELAGAGDGWNSAFFYDSVREMKNAREAQHARDVAEQHAAANNSDDDNGGQAQEPAATTETASSQQTGGTAVYEAAAAKLHAAAEQVDKYRAELAAMADGLAAKQWGTEVHGPIGDMDSHLAEVAGSYRDLAAQMQQQGDAVNDAHDQHPYVPGGDAVLA